MNNKAPASQESTSRPSDTAPREPSDGLGGLAPDGGLKLPAPQLGNNPTRDGRDWTRDLTGYRGQGSL